MTPQVTLVALSESTGCSRLPATVQQRRATGRKRLVAVSQSERAIRRFAPSSRLAHSGRIVCPPTTERPRRRRSVQCRRQEAQAESAGGDDAQEHGRRLARRRIFHSKSIRPQHCRNPDTPCSGSHPDLLFKGGCSRGPVQERLSTIGRQIQDNSTSL